MGKSGRSNRESQQHSGLLAGARGGKRTILPPYIFKVLREDDRVLLEPLRETDVVHLSEHDEFITGFLKVNPWKDDSKALGIEQLDGNRRQTRD